MADAPSLAMRLEIRRCLATTIVGTWVGLAIWMVRYYRLSRCPACNALLMYLFQSPPLYQRCPYCHTPLQ